MIADVETVSCACGCGSLLAARDNRGRQRRYLRGHNDGSAGYVPTETARRKLSAALTGRPVSTETREKIAATKRGELNAAWKGDAAGYAAIHNWLARHFQKCGTCEECLEEKPTEWANISGHYLRERTDFRELCVRCHRRYDLSKTKG